MSDARGARGPVSRPTLWALAGLFTLALVVRFTQGDHSLWFDEFASVFFSEQPVSRLWSWWMVRETNPPLYYSLLKGWIAVFGVSTLAVRALSIVAGLAGLVALSVTALRLYGERAALAVAALGTISAEHIYFSQLARGYIFAFDGVALSLIGLLWLFRDGPVLRSRIGPAMLLYIAGSLVAIHSHTTLFLWPAMASMGVLLVCWRDLIQSRARLLLVFGAANLVVLMAAGWWRWVTAMQLGTPNDNIGWIKVPGVRDLPWLFSRAMLLVRMAHGSEKIALVAVIALAITGAVRTWSQRTTKLITVLGVISTGGLALVGMYKPILTQLTVFWPSVFSLLLAGMGLGSIKSRRGYWSLLAAVTVLLGINLQLSRWSFIQEDWTGALRRVAGRPNAMLVVESEPMGLLARRACRVTFPGAATCPVRVLTVQTGSHHFDRWARGLYGSPILPWEAVPKIVPPSVELYTFRHDPVYDPGTRLLGLASSTKEAMLPDLQGPFHAAQFARVGTPPQLSAEQVMTRAQSVAP